MDEVVLLYLLSSALFHYWNNKMSRLWRWNDFRLKLTFDEHDRKLDITIRKNNLTISVIK